MNICALIEVVLLASLAHVLARRAPHSRHRDTLRASMSVAR
jgi:hypothetical protein